MQRSISLSGRLLITAQFVKGGGTLADVGTDHAYLPVWLIQQEIVDKAIACDIREKPLNNARETVKRFNLEDRISLRLSDGLDAVSADEADEIVFAGMGGTLISDIIRRTPWLKNKDKHLVIQPQTRVEELRCTLSDGGYEILGEKAVFEGKRVYIAMHAVYSGINHFRPPSFAYIGRLSDNLDDSAIQHLKKQAKVITMKIKGCRNSGDEQGVGQLSKILEDINEVIYG